MSTVRPHRFYEVPGYDERINDIIYCRPHYLNEKNPDLVIYFGGDVQNFPEVMETCKENKRYIQWNLENTALLLNSYFPNNHVMVIRPSRMQYNTFSCFDNFVPCVGNTGAPNHISSYNALQHLNDLIKSLTERLQSQNSQLELQINSKVGSKEPKENDNQVIDYFNLNKSHILLIGFSKGCVVLNQFLYEFYHIKMNADSKTENIISRIKEMYWLDGGHSGGKNTWITSEKILENFANLHIKIQVHVTPYQVKDKKRPWIHDEEKLFYEILHRFDANINNTLHFEHEPVSLQSHFKILDVVFQSGNALEM